MSICRWFHQFRTWRREQNEQRTYRGRLKQQRRVKGRLQLVAGRNSGNDRKAVSRRNLPDAVVSRRYCAGTGGERRGKEVAVERRAVQPPSVVVDEKKTGRRNDRRCFFATAAVEEWRSTEIREELECVGGRIS